MYEADVQLFRSPSTGRPLRLSDVRATAPDGEILEADLIDEEVGTCFPIRSGIPRFIVPGEYNESWGSSSGGYSMLGAASITASLTRTIRPIRFTTSSIAMDTMARVRPRAATSKLAIDIGCGIGQYSVRLAQEYAPKKLVAVDLTGGVDIFRAISCCPIPSIGETNSYRAGEYFRTAVREGAVRFRHVARGADAYRRHQAGAVIDFQLVEAGRNG